MARLVPPQLPNDSPHSERAVFEELSKLPEPWTVVSDIPIGVFARPRPGLEQIDFLAIHPTQGVVVLEVKGGEISIEDGVWFTRGRGRDERSPLRRPPMTQAANQRFELQRFLWKKGINVPDSAMAHAIVLPDCEVNQPLGPDAPVDLVVDAIRLQSLESSLQRVMKRWKTALAVEEADLERMLRILKPKMELTIVLASQTAIVEQAIQRETRRQVKFTQSQVSAYQLLHREARALVMGEAGTGKTVLAIDRARKLAETGERTLLLCHRAAVLASIQTTLGDQIDYPFDLKSEKPLSAAHWTGLQRALTKGRDGEFAKATSHDLPEQLLDAVERLDARYDAIVIDEGQEFTPQQLEGVTWLLEDPERGPFYLFADPFQHSGLFSANNRIDREGLRGAYDWAPPMDLPLVTLTDNVRNSRPIADLAGGFVLDRHSHASVEGAKPEFRRATRIRDVADGVAERLSSLLRDEGYRPNQLLVVLIGLETPAFVRAAQRSSLDLLEIIQAARFPLTPADLRVAYGAPDHVQGLEAEVVLVGCFRDGPLYLGDARDLYVTFSRARSHLIVISNRSEGELLTAAKVALANPDVRPGGADI